MGRPEKIRLGEILVQQKLLTEEQLKNALASQKKTGRRLGRVVIELGFVTEEQISQALARQLGVPFVNLKHYNLKREATLKLPETQARRFRALVLEDAGDHYKVAMADPADLTAYDGITAALKRQHQDRARLRLAPGQHHRAAACGVDPPDKRADDQPAREPHHQLR